VQHRKSVIGRALIVFVVGDQSPANVRGQDFSRLEMLARKGRFARPRHPDQYHKRKFRNGEIHNGQSYHARRRYFRVLGSNISRRPSPRRLKPSTASIIARPGKIASQGADSTKLRASFSISPHEASGGCGPKPRKLKPASVNNAHDSAKLVVTSTGSSEFGNI